MRFVSGLAAIFALGACNALFGVDELTYVATGGAAGHVGAGAGGSGIGGSPGAGGSAAGGSAAGGSAAGGSAAGGSAAGGSAAGGGDCAPDTEAFYVVTHATEDSLVIDGSCADAAWEDVPMIPFEGSNNTDNGINCRLMWREVDNRLFGCCVFSDNNLEANVTQPDQPATTDDDAFSYYLLEDGASPRPKVTINAAGAVADGYYNLPFPDFTYNANVTPSVMLQGTLNVADIDDSGWTVEWQATIAHDALPGQRVSCNFQMADRDGGVPRHAAAGPDLGTSFDDPDGFAKCQLACQSEP